MNESTEAIRSVLAANGFKLELIKCHGEIGIKVTRPDTPDWHGVTTLLGGYSEEMTALQTAGWAIDCWENDAWLYEEDKP